MGHTCFELGEMRVQLYRHSPPMVGECFFLFSVVYEWLEKNKRTRRHPLRYGDFNTPAIFFILKKKYGGFDCYFKTAVRLLVFYLAHENSAATTTFFKFTVGRFT